MPRGGYRPGAGRPKGGGIKRVFAPVDNRRAPRSPRFNLYEALHYVDVVEKLMQQPPTFRHCLSLKKD